MKNNYLWCFVLLMFSHTHGQHIDYLSPTTGEVETYSSIDELYEAELSLPLPNSKSKITPFKSGCPTGNVVLATQAEVDAFVAQFPNCTEIDGDLTIGNFGANPPVNDITDISGLNGIESVANMLGIFRTSLTTLASFDNLTSVNSVQINNNPEITNITGFNNLIEAEGVVFGNNAVLTEIAGFSSIESLNSLQIQGGHPVLNSVTGFSNLETIAGIFRIGDFTNQINNISGFSSLENVGLLYVIATQLTDLSILDGVTIEAETARIDIQNNPVLTSLPNLNFVGPVRETIIFNNPLLTDLTGLESLTKSNVWIENNAGLTSLNGLQGLQESNKWVPSAVGVRIINNQNLTNLNALSNLEDLDRTNILVTNNANLTDISGLDNVSFNTVNQLNISGNANLATCESLMVCNFLSVFPSKANINNNAVGCNSVAEVQAACQPLSINEFTSSDIKVYPNPFIDNIEVKLPAGVQNAKLRLMSLTGKVLLSSSINSSTSTIKGIDKLNSGLYLLQVELETGQKLTYKVMK